MQYKICTRCVVDTTVPGIRFDETGECNYCKAHDKLDGLHPLNAKGANNFRKLIKEIKIKGEKRKYDCVLGISGGRDSTYSLYLLKKLGLRPLAVHFNDGFGNPVAGENIRKAVTKLNVDLVTVTSDWRESKDLKLAFLKASTPDLEEATDIGIATALYGTATKHDVKYIIIGQSFRTEGVSPLEWNYLDGAYLHSVHKKFGSVKLKKWKPDAPGFNLNVFHFFYYTMIRQIKTVPILNYIKYTRRIAEAIIKKEFDWVYPGAHFYDDLYQSLMSYVLRVKFNIDRRKIHYAALVRSGQMPREEALNRLKEVYVIEDPDVISLCIKRLGISREDFESHLKSPIKTFRDYPTCYPYIKAMKPILKILTKLNILPYVSYCKYFEYDV